MNTNEKMKNTLNENKSTQEYNPSQQCIYASEYEHTNDTQADNLDLNENLSIDVSDVILETERLILRYWKQSDLNDFYEYASVSGVGEMAGWKPHESIEKTQSVLEDFIKEKNVFAITLKKSGKVVGSFGIHKLTRLHDCDKGGTINKACSNDTSQKTPLTAEIGYVLSKSYWGQGIMPEAARHVIKWCFEKLGLSELTVTHFEENLQSKSVILKCGFTPFDTAEFYSEKLDAYKKSIKYRLKNPLMQQ